MAKHSFCVVAFVLLLGRFGLAVDTDSWSSWNEWTACTSMCGGGDQFRERYCHRSNGSAAYDCPGMSIESRKCATQDCAAVWSPWTEWSSCNCAGEQERTRVCYHYHQNSPPTPATNCHGSGLQTLLCHKNETLISSCAQDTGSWSSWNVWTACTARCGGGDQFRERYCHRSNGFTANDCPGMSIESRKCATQDCTAVWSPWTEWSSCNCAGEQERTRVCYHHHQNSPPTPANNCHGSVVETLLCHKNETLISSCAQVTGSWSAWDEWTACTATCGGGDQFRMRYCHRSNGSTANDCPGLSVESRRCATEDCSGVWTAWSDWTNCTELYNNNIRIRVRNCTNDEYTKLKIDCQGHSVESLPCPEITYTSQVMTTKPPDSWNNWSSWTICTATCGGGVKYRSRNCTTYDQIEANNCNGPSVETELCNNNVCVEMTTKTPVFPLWSEWSSWSACTLTCNGGARFRARDCLLPNSTISGNCEGQSFDYATCATNSCLLMTMKPPDLPVWSEWSSWTACSYTCNGGAKVRSRDCQIFNSAVPGTCEGQSVDIAVCSTDPCPYLWKPSSPPTVQLIGR